MDVVEELNSPLLKKDSTLQLHCIDSETIQDEVVQNLQNLSFSVIIGHVSFLHNLEERRMVYLFVQDKLQTLEAQRLPSPVVIEVTSSCMLEVPTKDGEEDVEVICDFDVDETSIGTSVAVRPKKNMATEIMTAANTMPYLDIFKCEYCNCHKFPKIGPLVVADTVSPVDQHIKDHTADSNEAQGQQATDDPMQVPDIGDVTFFTCKMKLKGISYHQDFQVTIKRCRELIAATEVLFLKLKKESDNFEDCNAVIAQVKMQGHWKIVGYVPAKKVPKVQVALHLKEITEVRLDSIRKTYNPVIGKHVYVPIISVTKQNPWLQDKPDYEYNDAINLPKQ
eukprot:Seg1810.4 transcript_id=Seg1810.4/GoldUCD/mRNA.D3Y31 product="hypothetical protein" protein_id=Seg1810.4/GoldUCD/D3Y31